MKLPDHPSDDATKEFGNYEEEAIISMLLDNPDEFNAVSKFLTPKMFLRPEVRVVSNYIIKYYENYNYLPSREIIRDIILKDIKVEDDIADQIVSVLDRKTKAKESQYIKDTLIKWAQKQSYGMIYSDEAIDQYRKGNYEHVETLIEQAKNVEIIKNRGLKFYDEIDKLFTIEEKVEKFTTGIAQLDCYLSDGGPSRGETLCWMAPTGVGKSLMLINNMISNSIAGKKVLFITFELSDIKSAIRGLGALTDSPIDKVNLQKFKDRLIQIVRSARSSGAGDIIIQDFPPDEISPRDIDVIIKDLEKRDGWKPDLVIIDYLELMIANRRHENKDDYTKQKSVSTQIRGVAKKNNVGIFTATQTNRSGNDGKELIGVNKMAESYGKSMPLDYLISINQSPEEYQQQPAQARLYIAKNRNGQKFVNIPVTINYKTMAVRPSINY